MKTQETMKKNKMTRITGKIDSISLAVIVAVGMWGASAQAQQPNQSPAVNMSPENAATAKSLSELRDKVSRLEATMQSHQASGPQRMASMPGMPMRDGMSNKMSAAEQNAGVSMGAGAMPTPGASMGMDMMKGMSGMTGMEDMNMMGQMGDTPAAMQAMQSGLPGFPGASHLYHIGATGFFTDHPQHITLTTEQQNSLNKMKEQAELAKASAQRNIEKAEQELWTLTAADQPDIGKIEAKVREIEKLSSDERLAFIRSVGEAAKLLTAEQRKMLTGFASPAPAAAPSPSSTMSPMEHM